MINNWVELAGLPGVGKTTLVESMKPWIAGHYKIVESRRQTFRGRVVAKILFLYWLLLKNLPKDLAAAFAYRHSFRFFLPEDRSVFFYDSGLAQLVFEYLILNPDCDREAIWKKLAGAPFSRRLIYLYDDETLAVSRELTRDSRRFPGLDPLTLSARYKAEEEYFIGKIFSFIPDVYKIHISDTSNLMEALKK